MNSHNATIMGESFLSGGGYGTVKIMGCAWAKEDLEAEQIRVLGTAEFRGLKAGKIKVLGSARFEGPLNAKTLDITGSAETLSTVKAQEITVFGSLIAKEEVSAEKFLAKGTFELTSLNANDVIIKLAETCRVRKIGAENVKVGPISRFRLGFFGSNHKKSLQADTIEADHIELTNTVARIVKGNQVIIGPGCEIETVEYKDSLEIDHNAKVEKQIKVR